MIKVPFYNVFMQVEKFYQEDEQFMIDMNPSNKKDLDYVVERTKYISDYIEACGWTIKEFNEESIRLLLNNKGVN